MAGEKILVVEDNEVNSELITAILQSKGYAVLSATNGQLAVEEAERSMPALILMDMQLPVMDGYQTTRLIRQTPPVKTYPYYSHNFLCYERRQGESPCLRLRRLYC